MLKTAVISKLVVKEDIKINGEDLQESLTEIKLLPIQTPLQLIRSSATQGPQGPQGAQGSRSSRSSRCSRCSRS